MTQVIGSQIWAAGERLSAHPFIDELSGRARLSDLRSETLEALSETSIRKLLRSRLQRHNHFKATLFADPAWDMLLELFASDLGQRRVTITNLAIASAVPATTALRWMAALQKEGLIQYRDDQMDRRRRFVELSDSGIKAMTEYFRSLADGVQPI